MNLDDLSKLGKNAQEFARSYVQLKEELLRQGVDLEEAKETARAAALMAIIQPEKKEPWDL